MKKFLIILMIIIIEQTNQQSSEETDLFIVDGLPAKLGQFPWQVGIFIDKGNNQMLCGGALISNQWVLTAGHCIEGSASLLLGETNLKNYTNSSIIMKSGKIILHEDYNTLTLDNDIGLIQLKTPVKYNNFIKPIQLNDKPIDAGQTVIISGWGRTKNEAKSISQHLLFVPLKTITMEQCSKHYQSFLLGDGKICAASDDKKSICKGDSGGPLIIPSQPPLHVGIASFISSVDCENGIPQGFTKTSHFYRWIMRNCGCLDKLINY